MRKVNLCANNRRSTPLSANRLIGKLLDDLSTSYSRTGRKRVRNADIYEQDGKLNYELELPGFSKDEIQVKTKDGNLLITGEKDEGQTNEERNYFARRRSHSDVQRSFPLPEGIESSDDLTAEFSNGILHITAPLSKQEEKTVEVEIR
ncbi:MAG: Hsp20/alpha crystallin family protein [Candidatus Bipolaricaulota bacterium]